MLISYNVPKNNHYIRFAVVDEKVEFVEPLIIFFMCFKMRYFRIE